MTPGGKLGMSVAFISLLALIFINVYQTRSRREYLGIGNQTNDDGMNKWEDIPMSHVFCANSDSDVNSATHDDVETMDKMAKEIDDIAKSHLLEDIIDDTLHRTQDTLDLTQDTDAGADEEEEGFQGLEIVVKKYICFRMYANRNGEENTHNRSNICKDIPVPVDTQYFL